MGFELKLSAGLAAALSAVFYPHSLSDKCHLKIVGILWIFFPQGNVFPCDGLVKICGSFVHFAMGVRLVLVDVSVIACAY